MTAVAEQNQTQMTGTIMYIPVADIEENPVALRACNKTLDEYLELRDSIRQAGGVLQSIFVTPAVDATGKARFGANGQPLYRLSDGLQRWNSCKDLGIEKIPAIVMNRTDRQIYIDQLVLNSCRVETKHASYAAQLQRIMATDYTMTAAGLCKLVSKSASWLNDRLGLMRLDPEFKKDVDDGVIPITNAIELAKLPAGEEQKNFAERAKNETTAIFGPAVKQRLKTLREAAHAGRVPKSEEYQHQPHQRAWKEVRAAFENPTDLVEFINRKGITDPVEVVKEVLKWAASSDEASVEKGKADAEARKAKEAAEKVRLKEERAVLKAKEEAAVKKIREDAEAAKAAG